MVIRYWFVEIFMFSASSESICQAGMLDYVPQAITVLLSVILTHQQIAQVNFVTSPLPAQQFIF